MCIISTILCPCNQCIARPREDIELITTFRKLKFCDEVLHNPNNYDFRDSDGFPQLVQYCWPGKAIPSDASVGRWWNQDDRAGKLSAFSPYGGRRFVEDENAQRFS